MAIHSITRKNLVKVWFTAFFIVSVAILLLTGCGEKEPQSEQKHSGTIYFGVETPFHGFDILGSGGMLIPSMAAVNNLIQERLFRMDQAGNLIPVLGLSAIPLENGRFWDIKLRQGVLFHDDTTFDADAVVHHWAKMLNPENNFKGRKFFHPVRKVKKIDAYTVRFFLDHPWPPFLKTLSNELYFAAYIPSPKAVEEGSHDKKPVGTGPFKYYKWNSGDHFVVLKNQHYWQKGKPYLNKIVFRSLPDQQTRFASLVAGQLDAITIDRGNLIQKAMKDDSFSTYPSQGNGAEIVLINMTKPPLDDIRVRRALALANDQQLNIKMVYRGFIPFVRHPFGNDFKCEDDGYPEHDLEMAKQLILDYGKPVEIECLHTNTQRGRSTGELMQQLFKKIGVSLKPIGLSTGPHVMKVMKKDYQLATWRILSSNDHGPGLFRSFHSRSPANFTGYSNPEMDKMFMALQEATEPEKRDEILCKIARQLNHDVPFFYRGGRRYYVISKKTLKGMNMPGAMINLSAAWIDEKVKFNMAAYQIEQNASVVEFDCPEPGDVEAVRKLILGTWTGKDNWGATLTVTFKQDGTVTGNRSGRSKKTGKYIICGSKVLWGGGDSKVIVALSEDKLSGHWDYSEYRGDFVLARKPSP